MGTGIPLSWVVGPVRVQDKGRWCTLQSRGLAAWWSHQTLSKKSIWMYIEWIVAAHHTVAFSRLLTGRPWPLTIYLNYRLVSGRWDVKGLKLFWALNLCITNSDIVNYSRLKPLLILRKAVTSPLQLSLRWMHCGISQAIAWSALRTTSVLTGLRQHWYVNRWGADDLVKLASRQCQMEFEPSIKAAASNKLGQNSNRPSWKNLHSCTVHFSLVGIKYPSWRGGVYMSASRRQAPKLWRQRINSEGPVKYFPRRKGYFEGRLLKTTTAGFPVDRRTRGMVKEFCFLMVTVRRVKALTIYRSRRNWQSGEAENAWSCQVWAGQNQVINQWREEQKLGRMGCKRTEANWNLWYFLDSGTLYVGTGHTGLRWKALLSSPGGW
jgi:hypothetical protein